jgi:hypothetical protein
LLFVQEVCLCLFFGSVIHRRFLFLIIFHRLVSWFYPHRFM